jgi:hypothetical protein
MWYIAGQLAIAHLPNLIPIKGLPGPETRPQTWAERWAAHSLHLGKHPPETRRERYQNFYHDDPQVTPECCKWLFNSTAFSLSLKPGIVFS